MSQTERRPFLALLRVPARYARVATGGLAVCALAVALLGQQALDRWPASLWGWALLLAGAAGLGLLMRGEALERARVVGQATERPRLVWLSAALVLAALAFPGFAGNRFRLLPTALWLASLAVLYRAFAAGGQPALTGGPNHSAKDAGSAGRTLRGPGLARLEDPQNPLRVTTCNLGKALGSRLCSIRQQLPPISWQALALVAILLVGGWLRFYRLDAIPREMGTDMPHNYYNAQQIMHGQFMIFCPSYPGRESLFFYLLAGCAEVCGLGFLSIKLTSALVGLATVAALYGVARDLFDREVALVGAALVAVSKWHVILSRTGYRASLMPLAVLAVLYLLVRALRHGRGRDWVLAGMATGLGMYTYNAFIIVPAAVAAALAVELALEGRGALRRRGWGLVGLALAALVAFLPLGRYALEEPDQYLFRVATRVTAIERPLPADLLGVFVGNLWRAAGMFNLRGDEVFYSNVPEQRQLGAVSGVLFVAGLAYALARWRRGRYGLILVLLSSLILPTALAVAFPREVPNAVRASGVIVPAYLLAALPLVLLRRRLRPGESGEPSQGSPGLRLVLALLPAVLVVALLGAELAETRHAYFEEYVAHLPGRNYAISLEIARVLDDFAPQGQAFVKIWPHWFDGNALRAQLKVMSTSWDWEVPELDPSRPPLATARGKLLFIVHPDDRATLQMLAGEFPGGVASRHCDNNGRVAFVTFYGER